MPKPLQLAALAQLVVLAAGLIACYRNFVVGGSRVEGAEHEYCTHPHSLSNERYTISYIRLCRYERHYRAMILQSGDSETTLPQVRKFGVIGLLHTVVRDSITVDGCQHRDHAPPRGTTELIIGATSKPRSISRRAERTRVRQNARTILLSRTPVISLIRTKSLPPPPPPGRPPANYR